MNQETELPGQRIVYFSSGVFAQLMIEGSEHHFLVKQGLPADAKPIRAFPKPPTGLVGEEVQIAIVFASKEWEPLYQGMQIPVLTPWFEKIDARL